MVQKLKLYLHLERNDEAVELAQLMIEENPDDNRYVYMLGGTYYIIGDYEMTEKTYLNLLEEDTDDATALQSLVELYAQTDEINKYEIFMERLLKNEKFDSEERMKYVANHLLYLDYTDSIRAKTFIQELAEQPFCQLEHNEIYLQYLEYKEAPKEEILPVLCKIIELEPENVNALIKMLTIAIDWNDADAVLNYSDEALLYLPHAIELYFYKGLSYFILEEEEKSIEVLEQGIAACHEEAEPSLISSIYALMGDIYNSMEMKEKCYAAYDSALVYNPYNMEVLNNYAYTLAHDRKKLQKALEMSKKTIDAEPENDIHLDTYAWILFCMKRYEEAKAYAEKILSFDTELSYVVLHHIGDIYAKCGDIEKALVYWKQAEAAGDETKILKKKIRKEKYYNGKY
jgi:tetratricopeptide (TPR) repeat protein